MSQNAQKIDHLIDQVAQTTGVKADDVRTVLDALGLDYAIDSMVKIAGPDKFSAMNSDNLVVGLRYENVLIAK